MSDNYNLIFTQRHPDYTDQKDIWERSKKAYSGGRKYINLALIKHVAENPLEWEERKRRAYYFNYPRKISQLITQYILAEEPQRQKADEDIVEDFSRSGLRVNEVMRQVSNIGNVSGALWIRVDMPRVDGELTLAKKKANKIRPYASVLSPELVTDWEYGSDGQLNWAIINESQRVHPNPFEPAKTIKKRRLWTREDWTLFTTQDDGSVQTETKKHHLKCVPLIRYEETDGYGIEANHWFEDVVRVSDAILNAESEAQMNIVKQMYGLLVLPLSFRDSFSSPPLKPCENHDPDKNDDAEFNYTLARSAAIFETPEDNGISRYIAPDGATTEEIRKEITNLITQLFDIVGMAIRKDTREAESAESKAWDHQGIIQGLATRADALEQVELKIWKLMNLWDSTIKVPEIHYNREFSVLDLLNAVSALLELSTVNAGPEFSRAVSRAAVKLLDKVNKLSPESEKKIHKEIDEISTEIPLPEMPDNTE